MGLLRNIADKLKGKKQEAIEIDYNPQEEPEGLRRDDVDMHDKKQRALREGMSGTNGGSFQGTGDAWQ